MNDTAANREPAVAGRFYPGDRRGLADEVAALMGPVVQPQPAIALIGPHAGYMYSGGILGETYARAVVPRTVILMGPNHTGLGVSRSLSPDDGWRLPTGTIPVDQALGAALREHCGAQPDRDAHRGEHAIEVHLPFVLARQPDVRIAALCLAGLSVDACQSMGEGLARVVQQRDEPVLLVASTDMSHYISATEAAALDGLALDRVEALDPAGLLRTVRSHGITMCGVVPTAVALFAARALGATSAQLVRYGNSAERSGDYERVVGYAGVLVR